MGRKRWWKGGLELLVLCCLQRIVLADGEVGCLFNKNVCRAGVETCFDDSAFGRCIRPFDELEEDDVYRYDLDSTQLEILRRQLERLVVGGYEWTHPYTQCIIQGSLYNLRYRLKHDLEFCRELENLEERPAFDDYGDDDVPDEDPQPLAVVNFTPARGHGYGDFANEKYYPPTPPKKPKHNSRRPLNENSEDDYTYAYSAFRKSPERQQIAMLGDMGESINRNQENQRNDDIDGLLMDSGQDSMNGKENLNDASKTFRELAERLNVKYDRPMYRLRRHPRPVDHLLRNLKSSQENYYIDSIKDVLRDGDRDLTKMETNHHPQNSRLDIWKFINMNKTFAKPYSENLARLEFLRNENNEDNDEKEDDDEWLNRNTGDDDEIREESENEEDNDRDTVSEVEEAIGRSNNREKNGMYTEGGLVQPLDLHDVIRQGQDYLVLEDDLNALLLNRDLTAFQRPERLDVKKPGPLFSTNNYAFKTQSPPIAATSNEGQSLNHRANENDVLRSPVVKKMTADVKDNGKMYKNVDIDHIYIEFNNEFREWDEGERIVEAAAKLLGFSPDVFTNIRVGRAEVTFKVVTDDPYLDAIAVAPMIDRRKDELSKATGWEVLHVGIGDKVKLPPIGSATVQSVTMSSSVFGAIVAAGGAAAAAAAIVTLIIARKHAKSRAKLAGLATPDPEASKDYQELCRARMHAKQPNEKPESPRIISLSRESESNRSSTSSWGEEAAALTNMDISTGHMVLTYMEDHLKNKDRLDQEWAGICAYEADPSSVAIATDKANADNNRPGSSLPYDHSRVVLNDLSNANNSDYINASTITDHDPRNPAYIATQGPLPQTSADFWQLVWEQGSVVIVMLTRLTEEGRGMCHRYWPEEGSELYHIYEVHIVSEHIWSDDYLVRSFYLKNLKTGETRTVTQFHFLSWPENGVPQSTKALLEFRRKVNKSYRGRSCPIVVHCSDGAGRTGTYCLIDMVLNRMAKGAKEIDIAAALEHIRDQRPGMVATKQQFEFVLVAVAEEVHAILKALPVQSISEKSQPAVASAASTAQSSSGSEQ